MKTQLLLLLIVFLFKSLFVTQTEVVFKGFNQPPLISESVKVFVDSINAESIPCALLKFYYNNLSNEDVFEIKMVVDTLNSTRNLRILTKQAGDGYMFVNAMIADWAIIYSPFDYIIDRDTVNSKLMVEKLVSLRKEYVDSVVMNNTDRMVIIKTREDK